jgi:hypothetical protein
MQMKKLYLVLAATVALIGAEASVASKGQDQASKNVIELRTYNLENVRKTEHLQCYAWNELAQIPVKGPNKAWRAYGEAANHINETIDLIEKSCPGYKKVFNDLSLDEKKILASPNCTFAVGEALKAKSALYNLPKPEIKVSVDELPKGHPMQGGACKPFIRKADPVKPAPAGPVATAVKPAPGSGLGKKIGGTK